ncbi:hypothetical protein Nmel_001442 [Mimus melanotis]
MLMPVLGSWKKNLRIFFSMRSVFTCTYSCHFLLFFHFLQECHIDLLFCPTELKAVFCS